MTARDLTPGEVSVLTVLNTQWDRGQRWLTPGQLAKATELERERVVGVLSQLRRRELARAIRGRWGITRAGLELLAAAAATTEATT